MSVRLQRFDVEDTTLGLVARSFLGPGGWALTGGVQWVPTPNVIDRVQEAFQVVDPDGAGLLARMPPYTWQWSPAPFAQSLSQQNGSRFGPPMTCGEVLERVIAPSCTGGPPPVRATHDPDGARAALEREQAHPLHPQVLAMGGQVHTDAANLAFIHGGRAEHLRATLVAVTFPGPMGPTTQVVVQDVWRTSTRVGAESALAPVYATMFGSMQVNPLWQEAVRGIANQEFAMQREHNARMHQITMDGIRRQGEIMARQGDWLKHVRIQDHSDAHDRLHASWRANDASSDRVAALAVEGVRGVDTWQGAGDAFQIPIGWDRAFTNGSGEVVVTNDASFDPASLPGAWSPLSRR